MYILTKPADMIMKFYNLLLDGEINNIKAMFAGEPLLNEPTKGIIKGDSQLDHFTRNYRHWMQRRNPSVKHSACTITDKRIVEECVLHLRDKDEAIDLPVAIVADLKNDKLSHVRIYYSMWPLFNKHMVRPPILTDLEAIMLPPPVEDYMKKLDRGNAESIIKLFGPDGYVREPSGEGFKHAGPDGLKNFYNAALAEGGISLKPCTCTYDGVKCAVEFNIYKWGKTALPPQAGVAVYEKGSSGLLAAVRIYDDVAPPF